MPNAGGHDDRFASLEVKRLIGNHDLCFSLHDLYHCIERRRMGAQPLSFVKGKEGDSSNRAIDYPFTHNPFRGIFYFLLKAKYGRMVKQTLLHNVICWIYTCFCYVLMRESVIMEVSLSIRV